MEINVRSKASNLPDGNRVGGCCFQYFLHFCLSADIYINLIKNQFFQDDFCLCKMIFPSANLL